MDAQLKQQWQAALTSGRFAQDTGTFKEDTETKKPRLDRGNGVLCRVDNDVELWCANGVLAHLCGIKGQTDPTIDETIKKFKQEKKPIPRVLREIQGVVSFDFGEDGGVVRQHLPPKFLDKIGLSKEVHDEIMRLHDAKTCKSFEEIAAYIGEYA